MPVLALTATALPKVVKAICVGLELFDPVEIISSPERVNIKYTLIRTKSDDKDRYFQNLISDLKNQRESTDKVLIYVANMKHGSDINK